MQKIIFLVGLPASGKSTWAIQKCNTNPKYKRINKDDIRETFGEKPWSREFEKEVLKFQRKIGNEYLDMNYSLIVDDTNFSDKHWDYWKNIADTRKIKIDKKTFDTPLEECIERDKNREKAVGEQVIRMMYNRNLKPKNYIKNDNRFILNQNESLPRAIICDLDGTLSLMNNRSPFDNKKVINDKLNYPVKQILDRYYKAGVKIIFLSGRSEDARENTEKWIKKNIDYCQVIDLHMRKSNDFRSDSIVKQELFDNHIKDHYYIEFVLDDRDSVVKTWRDLGLLCLQVYYGNF